MATPFTLPIELVDVNSTRDPNGLLTDTTIRTIINYYGNTSSTSHITFVDPTWLSTWEATGMSLPSPLPSFLTSRNQGGHRPIGLAMPYHEPGDRWTVIYINLEARGAIYFNSLPGWGSHRAEHVRREFFNRFELFFQGRGEFRFIADDRCASQNNTIDCGIYAIRNTLDLLDHRRPDWRALRREEKLNFRRNATALLEANLGEREIQGDGREGAKGNTAKGGMTSPKGFGAWPFYFFDGKEGWGQWEEKPQKKKVTWSPFIPGSG